MLKQFLSAAVMAAVATTASAATSAAPATAAAPATVGAPAFVTAATNDDHLASKLIGTNVYDSNAANAQSIGTVSDLVVGNTGSIDAVVVGVGGFLGVGQKNVALSYSGLQWTTQNGKPALVASLSKTDLQNAPAFDTSVMDRRDAAAESAAEQQQQNALNPVPAPGALPNAGSNSMTAANQPAPSTQPMLNDNAPAASANVDTSHISAQDLMSTKVYSARNDDVGQVGDVVLTKDGKIDAMVIDVGGFLGIGQKPVAIAFDGVDIRKDGNGNLAVYTRFTKQQLQAAPTYDKNTYTAQRDTMRLSNPS
jgi:sporulation protein YlmC with PRC-barrel domain